MFAAIEQSVRAAEESGFDSVWVMDHFLQIPGVGAPSEPMFEAYTLLGALAAVTHRVRLGALVTGVTYRNPALVAKQVTALDVISHGRAVLGIGAAWYELEHRLLGFEFPPLAERFDRLAEALVICRSMFTREETDFEGRYYRVERAPNRPRPVQVGGPPILVGGGGERRTLRLVAEHADACNIFGDPATVRRKLEVLDRHCEDLGRDPSTITRTRLGTLVIDETAEGARRRMEAYAEAAGMDPSRLSTIIHGDPEMVVEQAAALFEAGLDGLIFNMPDVGEPELVQAAGSTLSGAFGSAGLDRQPPASFAGDPGAGAGAGGDPGATRSAPAIRRE